MKYYALQAVARDLGSKLDIYRVAKFLRKRGILGIKKVKPKVGKWGGARARGKKGEIWAITAASLKLALQKAFPELLRRKRS